MSKRLDAAIADLVDCWLQDGNVQHLHAAWTVLAKHVGREQEAHEVSGYRTLDPDENNVRKSRGTAK